MHVSQPITSQILTKIKTAEKINNTALI